VDYLLLCTAALVVAALTFFTGFGLGTLLMPVFALYFPIDIAIGATAIVHLANNIFSAGLVGKHADWKVVARFGIPAALAAILGAWLLERLTGASTVATYSLGSRVYTITVVKLVVAVVIGAFAALELSPGFASLSFPPRFILIGGAISGFFGGISGHQGALRSAFLLRLGMSKERFVATGKMTAIVIDLARLVVYGLTFKVGLASFHEHGGVGLVIAASLAAFAGSIIGARSLRKVKIEGLRRFIGVMLIVMALALGSGLI